MIKKSFYLPFICAIFLLAACSETHQDIYQYENVYLTSEIDDFKLSHLRKHVGDSVLYVNNKGELFDRGSVQGLCEKNAVKCVFVDLSLESKTVKNDLKTSLAQFEKLKSKPTLMVSEDSADAALLLSAYALQIKGANLSKADEISRALGVAPEQAEGIQKLVVEN